MILLASSSPTFEKRVRQAFGGSLNGSLERTELDSAQAVVDNAPDDLEVIAVGPDD